MTRTPPRLPRPAMPSQLADATGPAHQVARLRVRCQRVLQSPILLVAQVLRHQLREQLGFDKREHVNEYTSMTYHEIGIVDSAR